MRRILPLILVIASIAWAPAHAQEDLTTAPVAITAGLAPPPEGKGQVVFFRKGSMAGAPYAFTIKDGDKPVTKLGNSRYFVYVTDPGEHEFRVRGETKDSVFLEIEPGETYFVEQTMVLGMFYYANLAPSREEVFTAAKLKPGTAAK